MIKPKINKGLLTVKKKDNFYFKDEVNENSVFASPSQSVSVQEDAMSTKRASSEMMDTASMSTPPSIVHRHASQENQMLPPLEKDTNTRSHVNQSQIGMILEKEGLEKEGLEKEGLEKGDETLHKDLLVILCKTNSNTDIFPNIDKPPVQRIYKENEYDEYSIDLKKASSIQSFLKSASYKKVCIHVIQIMDDSELFALFDIIKCLNEKKNGMVTRITLLNNNRNIGLYMPMFKEPNIDITNIVYEGDNYKKSNFYTSDPAIVENNNNLNYDIKESTGIDTGINFKRMVYEGPMYKFKRIQRDEIKYFLKKNKDNYNINSWANIYFDLLPCFENKLIQFSGTCHLNAVLNSLVMVPEIVTIIRTHRKDKNIYTMTDYESIIQEPHEVIPVDGEDASKDYTEMKDLTKVNTIISYIIDNKIKKQKKHGNMVIKLWKYLGLNYLNHRARTHYLYKNLLTSIFDENQVKDEKNKITLNIDGKYILSILLKDILNNQEKEKKGEKIQKNYIEDNTTMKLTSCTLVTNSIELKHAFAATICNDTEFIYDSNNILLEENWTTSTILDDGKNVPKYKEVRKSIHVRNDNRINIASLIYVNSDKTSFIGGNKKTNNNKKTNKKNKTKKRRRRNKGITMKLSLRS